MNKKEIISTTKDILGPKKLKALEKLYSNLSGTPPSVEKQRFRADNPDLIDALNRLESIDYLIRDDKNNDNYILTCNALLLIESPEIDQLIELMNNIYNWCIGFYRKNLGDTAYTIDLIKDFPNSNKKILTALFYMKELHGIFTTKTLDFPFGEKSTFSVSENVLVRASFIDIALDYFRWHYINPRKVTTKITPEKIFKSNDSDYKFFNTNESTTHPPWFDELSDFSKAIIQEIDRALQNKLVTLSVLGIRALIEHVMIENIEDQRSFKKNLDAFAEAGFITKQSRNALSEVIESGHASMHRGYIPDIEDVMLCIDIVKHTLHGVYILEPKSKKLNLNTPPKKKKG